MKFGARIKRLRKRGPFLDALLLLTGGSVAGQLIQLAASPILTRLYSPRDLGIAGAYLSVMGFMSVGGMLRYETAIAATKNRHDAAVVTVLAATLGVVMALAAACCVPGAEYLLPHVYGDIRLLEPYLYWIPVGIAAGSVYLAFSMWAVRFGEYQAISRTRVWQAICAVTLQVGMPVLRSGPTGLIAGQIAGQSGGISGLARRALARDRDLFRSVTLRELWAAAKRYVRFPTLSLPAVLLDSLFLNAPIVILTNLYGVVVIGWVTLAQRIFFLPGILLGRSLTQVVIGEMSQRAADDSGSLEKLFWTRLKQLTILGLIVCAAAGALAPLIIPLVYGRKWSNAWICAEFLLPQLLASIVSTVFGGALDVLERQDLHLIREIGRFCILGVAMAVLYRFHLPWKGALAVIGLMSAVAYAWYLWISWWAIHRQPHTKTRSILPLGVESAME
jgi:O-antigen/teichoic acid export membrane protein